jgi:hypothetical protein
MVPSDNGIDPVSFISRKPILFNFFKVPMFKGIVPEILFVDRSRDMRLFMAPMVGIVPFSRLS